MTSSTPKSRRRTGLLALLWSVLLAVLFAYIGRTHGWTDFVVSAEAILILAAVGCLLYAFVRIRKQAISRRRRRVGVFLNYMALLVVLVVTCTAGGTRLDAVTAAVLFAGLFAVVVTFVDVHLKTSLWRLTHSSLEILDERQIQITHDCLQRIADVMTNHARRSSYCG